MAFPCPLYTDTVSNRHQQLLPGGTPWPATFLNLANWLADILQTTAITTAQTYLSGVHSYHVEHGLDLTLFQDERIKRLFRGAKRIVGIPSIRPRNEITKEILLAILQHLDVNLYDDLNIYAAFCTAFAAFLRCGEFTWDIWTSDSHLRHLSRDSVHFDPTGDSISLHLPASKTDPFRRGTVIPLARSPDASCPVAAL